MCRIYPKKYLTILPALLPWQFSSPYSHSGWHYSSVSVPPHGTLLQRCTLGSWQISDPHWVSSAGNSFGLWAWPSSCGLYQTCHQGVGLASSLCPSTFPSAGAKFRFATWQHSKLKIMTRLNKNNSNCTAWNNQEYILKRCYFFIWWK